MFFTWVVDSKALVEAKCLSLHLREGVIDLFILGLLVWKLFVKNLLVFVDGLGVGIKALIFCDLLPSCLYVWDLAAVEGLDVGLYHWCHTIAIDRFAFIYLWTSISHNFFTKFIDTFGKLWPKTKIRQLVQSLQLFLIINRPNQRKTPPIREVIHNWSLDLPRLLTSLPNSILIIQTILKILWWRYLSTPFILNFQHKIPQQPEKFRHILMQLGILRYPSFPSCFYILR